ncbi:urease accessory protein UreD [Cellulomonas sp. DKR-3]|uniref:Urease accessory protein UreD n=1 Tax=Cellulomonas fulva TaxID=2835530 RepID=A0ABS5TVE2_9CELL|nr:urease accessory protein UreD [Cellulomonas fulva]MBT0993119.1 urease accessory protein UreD [Cellulomonas fulva]
MRTTVEVERAGDRVRCVLRAGHVAPRVLEQSDEGAVVALVATGALLLGGDHVHVDVRVGEGVALELVETSGTVAYHGRGQASSWTAAVSVGRGARLVWDALPFVVSDGADVTRVTSLDVHDEGVALLRETLVLGRDGQRGGLLRTRTHARHAGEDLLVEELDLTGGHAAPGVLGPARVVDAVLLAGVRPAPATDGTDPGVVVLDLAGAGALARAVGTAAHLADVGPVLTRWRAHAVADRRPPDRTSPHLTDDRPGPPTRTDDRSAPCTSPTT